MTKLSKVVWSEGMHLGPHHFQTQNRYFEDLLHFATQSLNFKAYGFSGVQVDAESLRNGAFVLLHARGIMKDGLAFHMPECEPAPPPRLVADLFPPMQERLDLWLAVPPYSDQSANLSESSDTRFALETRQLADDLSGLDEKPVNLGRKNFRVLAAGEVPPEWMEAGCALPVARIRRDQAGQFTLDPTFIPPVLTLQASHRLMVMLLTLVEILEQKCRAVIRPKDLSPGAVAGFSAQGITNAWFLHCVNSSLGPMRHLALTKTAHPEELYREMLRLGGALCTFGLESHPSQLPLYNHDRPEDCFEPLDHHIRTHLELVIPSNFAEIPLTPTANYFWEGAIADQRLVAHSTRWILGIGCRVGESELISATPRLVKICSKEFLPKLVSRALPALALRHLSVAPPAISPKVDMQYFAIDKAGPCWDHMVATRQLGLYVPGELPDPRLELLVVLES